MEAQPLALPERARLVEVGPRDGLQNETAMLPTRDKIALIEALANAGLEEIEITSFTHPKWIPNLADAEEVARAVADLPVRSFALVPNRRGLERAIAAGLSAVTLVMSASEGHNRANLNRSREASLRELVELQAEATGAGQLTRISISVAFGCPFDGAVDPQDVAWIVETLAQAGARRFGFCDTIGVANPRQVYDLCSCMRRRFPSAEFELHLHDTFGMALANTLAGLQAGIHSFDTSLGGLGGCPFAPGATGNVSTERTLAMLDKMGVATGVKLSRIIDARRMLEEGFGPFKTFPRVVP